MYGSRQYFVGQSQTDSVTGNGGGQGHEDGKRVPNLSGSQNAPATVDVTSLDEPSAANSIARSYFMLNDKAQVEGEDPEDPFNKFWEVVENLVQKISITGPVAFTTAPLGNGPYSQDPRTGMPSVQFQEGVKDPITGRDLADTLRSTTMLNSYFSVAGGPPGVTIHFRPGATDHDLMTTSSSVDQNYFGGGSAASAGSRPSFRGSGNEQGKGVGGANNAVGSSGGFGGGKGPGARIDSGPVRNKTLEEYEIENQQLKQTVDFLTRRVAMLERAAEENNLLRSSIIQFRQDVQKQAKRFAQAGGRAGGGGPHMFATTKPPMAPPEAPADQASAMQRIMELEDELRRMREDHEKQAVAMARYKERWDKLKESAKRKKEAKVSEASPVPDEPNDSISLTPPMPRARTAMPPRPAPDIGDRSAARNPSTVKSRPFSSPTIPSMSSSPSSAFSGSPPGQAMLAMREPPVTGLAAGIAGEEYRPANVVTQQRRMSGGRVGPGSLASTHGRIAVSSGAPYSTSASSSSSSPGSAALQGRGDNGVGPSAANNQAGARSTYSTAGTSMFYSATSGGLGFE
ncbi:hypothetical protein HK104_000075 [Borealophlyctis nickersoniae]|nr:hypothetical protein HK104_000075 [Borealophlyctis nickersoniae]